MRVVAIDGPAGSGKSTVAREVARRLDLAHLDTGAMYRSVALAVLRRGIDAGAAEAVGRLAGELEIEAGERVILDGLDVTAEIRGADVNRVVSTVAANPAVRTEMVRRQREWAHGRGGGVIEGRDIGTVVFPGAELKVYLTATDAERARRRQAETPTDAEPGSAPPVDGVAAALKRRDEIDSKRAASPLRVAEGALVIDTTGMAVDEVVAQVLRRLETGAGPK